MNPNIVMAKENFYILPDLPYGYKDLEPHISEELLKLHHDKHHQAYVNAANTGLEKLDKAREEGSELDMKSVLKTLSFNIGGHLLHSLFWNNMSPKGGGEPVGELGEAIKKEFGGFERFKKEFSQVAESVEGSGWAALTYCQQTKRPLIAQIEKHNVNVYPAFNIVLVLDVWEHAYYLDYKNKRGDFINAFWNVVNWEEANKRL